MQLFVMTPFKIPLYEKNQPNEADIVCAYIGSTEQQQK